RGRIEISPATEAFLERATFFRIPRAAKGSRAGRAEQRFVQGRGGGAGLWTRLPSEMVFGPCLARLGSGYLFGEGSGVFQERAIASLERDGTAGGLGRETLHLAGRALYHLGHRLGLRLERTLEIRRSVGLQSAVRSECGGPQGGGVRRCDARGGES